VVTNYRLRFRSHPPLRHLLSAELAVQSQDKMVSQEVKKMLAMTYMVGPEGWNWKS
jgi:hypothetical protein